MRKKKTLSFQLIFTMLALVFGTIALCWFINNTFLEKYYVYNKQKDLTEGYKIIDKQAMNGTLASEKFDIPFERICSNGNIMIIVIDQNHNIVRSSTNNVQWFQLQINEIMFGQNSSQSTILQNADSYWIERQTDKRMDSEYLVLSGILSDGSIVYMRTALESIKESAFVTNRFFAYVGFAAIAISIFIIILLSKSISKPILELCDISQKMSNLEFEVKYVPKKHDSMEIDALGTRMNELSEALEKTITELKIANNELKQDIEKKEKIDEMRKEFLSNVSHELKTPLALIQGYSEGLLECVNDDKESRDFYCDVIIDEANKMNKMVKKLLTLNQLEFGNEVVELERFDLTELINGVVNASRVIAESKGIQIEFNETDCIYAWGDDFKVEEVLTNYISNAMNHADGEKIIRIFYTMETDKVRVSVWNTGKPIPVQELDKIWIKFYKVDKARTREYGGSGIGLSIVKAIMDSFHQKCGVLNHENGVEFWFELETNSEICIATNDRM